jgi:translation elongation factor EF-Tu-like GTPase
MAFDDYEEREGYIRAEVRVLEHAEGGRRHPIFDGYRPDWNIGNTVDGTPTINGAPISIEGADVAHGAETVVMRLHPIVPELWGHVTPGMSIDMHEGGRVVGVGRVLEVVSPANERSG